MTIDLFEYWQLGLAVVTLVVVLAKMHASIEVLQEKVKVLFELFNKRKE